MGGLEVRLFGRLSLLRDAKPVKLPASKKARALLAYLVITRRPHTRSRLCSLLWDVTDDPRGALRWCLSKVRHLVGAERIVTDGETIAFDATDAVIDLDDLRRLASTGLHDHSTDALTAIADRVAGSLLEGLELPEFHSFQAWCVAEREEARRLQCKLLAAVLDTLADDPERAIPYARYDVHLQPTNAQVRARCIRVLAATDRRREAEEHYHQGSQVLRDAGVDRQPLREAWTEVQPGASTRSTSPHTGALRQEVRFCNAMDGTRIAYATCGTGPVLLKAANWLSHLEYDWESPVWRHLTEFFASRNTYVRYDERGCGLSETKPVKVSFDGFVEDLEAVADAAEADRFTLVGISKGASVSIEYAARHPERVRGLIILGGFATGWEKRVQERGGEDRGQAILTLMRTGWGHDNPAFRQIFTSLFFPGATLDQVHFFNELQRVSATPENAVRLREATGLIDVRHRLADVKAPTLVLHVIDDAVARHTSGQDLAAGIKGARFASLEGKNHLPLEADPGWPRCMEQIGAFLDEIAEPA
jgi:DNA-binding SARP family transcriptional activator/pimeloyl-ACP methyl ester carboxylesterase